MGRFLTQQTLVRVILSKMCWMNSIIIIINIIIMSLLCVQFYHNSITTHNIKDYLKHIFLESNVLYANSNSGSMLEMQQVSAEWLGKSAHSYRKSFWGGEKKWSKKQTFPHGNVLWKKCRCCHAGVHVKRNISPVSHERKGERGGTLGCVTQE